MIYVASKASIAKYPEMWKKLRAEGWPIISTWIDEAGEGETSDWSELWQRMWGEVLDANGLVLWVEYEDPPHKGSLVEVGIALGDAKRIAVVSRTMTVPQIQEKVGSWIHHPAVRIFHEMEPALEYACNDFSMAGAIKMWWSNLLKGKKS